MTSSVTRRVTSNRLTRPTMENRTVCPTIAEHFRHVFEEKLVVKVPDNERRLTTAGRLMEKQREMQQMELALKSHKEEFKTKMEGLHKKRWEILRKYFNKRFHIHCYEI